ncbi:unnamed protein product [Mucor hiemalis]
MDVDNDFITVQQNKNIRTMIGLDFVGLSGYIFSAQYLESAVFITREADVYLPGDAFDFNEFMDECEEVLALIFGYRNYIVKQAQGIDQKCRALRRKRLVASKQDSREYLPPTFYSPER